MKTKKKFASTAMLDKVFSLLVRLRVSYRCEKCTTYYPEGNRQGLHCSHFFSRRNRSTRWDSMNAAAHCYKCHQDLGGNPANFVEWQTAHLGEREYAFLKLRAGTPRKFSGPDRDELYQEMRAQLKHMESRRASGEAGRIEFDVMMEVA